MKRIALIVMVLAACGVQVDLVQVRDLPLDIRYATTNNFTNSTG